MIEDRAILATVERQREAIVATVRFVHEHPELAHEEHECATRLTQALADAGYAVEQRISGMETAFRATLEGARSGRSIGVVALYDAVAAIRSDGSIKAVHSCGHGSIAGGVIGCALSLSELRRELAGRLVVVGCPADEIHAPGTIERGGGKALTAEAGIWDDLDVALYAHPEFIDTVSLVSRWMRRDRATVGGIRSLESVAQQPIEAARRALAALPALLPDVLLEHLELDGDVEEGSGLALRADFLLFADDEQGLAARAASLRDALQDASWSESHVTAGVRPDAGVTAHVAAAFRAAGRGFVDDPPPLPFATDFGNVSRRVPAALIGIGRPDGWAFHTDEGARQFASPAGEEAAMAIARVLALSVARLVEPAP